MMSIVSVPVSAASETKDNIVNKSYELQESVKQIQFTLEGKKSFSSRIILPDGKIIENKKSTEIKDKDGSYWVSSYSLTPAAKGTYRFEIITKEIMYFNLKVEIPLFSDIANHWAKDAISEFVKKGVVNGKSKGVFAPDAKVTGEELTKMLVMALSDENDQGNRQWARAFRWKVLDEEIKRSMGLAEYQFITKSGEHWSTPYIAAAKDLNVMKWSDPALKSSFKRKDVALLLYNIMQLTTDQEISVKTYNDTSKLSNDYQKAIALVSQFSIFNGYKDGTFRPDQDVTRAEAVIVLKRLIQYLLN